MTIANCYDTPTAWKVQPIKDKPGFALSRPAEWDGAIAESWATERDGAIIVLKVRKGVKFPSGRPVTAQAIKYCFDLGLQSPGYMRLLFPSLIGVKSPDQFEVRDERDRPRRGDGDGARDPRALGPHRHPGCERGGKHLAGGVGVAVAGLPTPDDALNTPLADVRAILDRNLLSCVPCCRAVTPEMVARRA